MLLLAISILVISAEICRPPLNTNTSPKVMPSLKGITKLILDGDSVIGPGVSFIGNVSIKVVPGKSLHLENQVFEDQDLLFD